MSRRCKPGQRARIIVGPNAGTPVVVVRYYHGEKVADANWPTPLFPWVIASLGAPLKWWSTDDPNKSGHDYTAVIEDSWLEPLNDDDSGAAQSTKTRKPKEAHS